MLSRPHGKEQRKWQLLFSAGSGLRYIKNNTVYYDRTKVTVFFHEKNKNILKSNPIRAGEVARQLRAITAPAKGPGSTPSTQRSSQSPVTPGLVETMPFSRLQGLPHTCRQNTIRMNKINLKNKAD